MCDDAKEGRAQFPLSCPHAPLVRTLCADGPSWRGLAGCRAGMGGQPDISPHTGKGEGEARELSAAKGRAGSESEL